MHRALAALVLSFAAPAWAATPASGELTDASGPLVFTGGPFVVPNPTSDTHSLTPTPLVCEPSLMNCDKFALKVAIPEKFRKDDKNKKQLVQIELNFKAAAAPLDAQADFELYLLDAAGTELSAQTSGAGIPELISLPLSLLKDGDYTIEVVAYNGLGGSYHCEARIGKGPKSDELSANEKASGGLLIGALGIPTQFTLFGLALLRHRRVR